MTPFWIGAICFIIGAIVGFIIGAGVMGFCCSANNDKIYITKDGEW